MFKKIIVESKFLTPLRDFEGDAQSIEYRMDPLLSMVQDKRQARRKRQSDNAFVTASRVYPVVFFK